MLKGTKHKKESLEKMSKIHKGHVAWNKGKFGISEETREKMRKAKLGYIPWNKNKKVVYSKETREKMKKSWFKKGMKISPEQTAKRKLIFSGSGNPAWKGGVTPIHEKIRKSPK